ncbi:hypothetical protein [Streptomyces sp. NPDC059639]|uniref:hypothetical protein n=1 Tax=Streptomyces sp. NPDC059639 TaxID=3346891 RepID=UPI003691340B
MKTRTAITAVALLAAALTGCTRTDANKQADCRTAITDGVREASRPDACKDLSEDDYQALLTDWVKKNKGFVDKNGNVDPDKLLSDN